jgi:maleylacetoacetate isomerase
MGVPTLELADGSCLVESMAICEYLEEAHPEVPMLPKDAVTRARIRGFCEVINSGIHPYQNLRLLNRLEEHKLDKMAFAKEFNERGLAAVEEFLKASAGKYSFGDNVTLADAFLYPQFVGATKRFGIQPENYPTAKKVCDNLSTLKEFQDASPENQADF